MSRPLLRCTPRVRQHVARARAIHLFVDAFSLNAPIRPIVLIFTRNDTNGWPWRISRATRDERAAATACALARRTRPSHNPDLAGRPTARRARRPARCLSWPDNAGARPARACPFSLLKFGSNDIRFLPVYQVPALLMLNVEHTHTACIHASGSLRSLFPL